MKRSRVLIVGIFLFGLVPPDLAHAGPPSSSKSASILRVDPRGMPRWIEGSLGHLDVSDVERSGPRVVAKLAREWLGGSGKERLALIRLETDLAGRSHLRFQQTLRGLEVVGDEVVLHVHSASGEVLGLSGRVVPDLGWLPTEPGLDAETALRQAADEAGLFPSEAAEEPALVFYLAFDAREPVLAWAARVRYRDDAGLFSDRLFADASTGALVARHRLQADAKVREVYDLCEKAVLPGVLVLSDAAPASGECSAPPAEGTEEAAGVAHSQAGLYYDALYGAFGRDSSDGRGRTLKTAVHHGFPNVAGYDFEHSLAYFGNGTPPFVPNMVAAFDLVAHEQSHGLVYDAAGLTYDRPSGTAALHESLADVFAAVAEAWISGGVTPDTWKMFEDLALPGSGHDATRYLDDPARDERSLDHFSEYDTSLAPHYNAGILNLAFHLLTMGGEHPRPEHRNGVTVSGVGLQASRNVFYAALLSLGSGADMEDFRLAALAAAVAGYGEGSNVHRATHDAFCVVGFACDREAPLQYVDVPVHDAVVSGDTYIHGWAIDASGVRPTLSLLVDGQPAVVSEFTYGDYRKGVCDAHPEIPDPNCPHVGWSGRLDTTRYANGSHTLQVRATDRLGRTSYASRRFVIDNPPRTVSFDAVADSWVDHLDPTANHGSDPHLDTRADTTGRGRHAYLKFSVSGVAGTVVSAKLRIRTRDTSFPSARVYHIATTTWSENAITWNDAPLDFLLQYGIGALAADSWQEIDVRSIVTGNGTYSIGLVAADAPGLGFWSLDSVYPPTLVVTYQP